MLALLAGCRGPAAPYLADRDAACAPRCVVVARQLVEDSAAEVAQRPLCAGRQLLCETADHVQAVAAGGIGKRLVMPLQGPPPELRPEPGPPDLARLEEELQRLTGRELQPADVRLHIDGREALDALLGLIDSATEQIDVVMFQWDNDAVGRAVAERLAARAAQGVRVRVLIDGGGNQFFGGPDGASAAQVNEALAVLARTGNVQLIRIRNAFGRYDHRKLVLIDGRVVWTGGRNLSDNAFHLHHDLSFSVEGPLAAELQGQFDGHWERQGGPAAHTVRRVGPDLPAVPACANARARLLHSEPGRRELARAVYAAVDHARHRIYVENVYLSDSLLIHKLAQARRRGVEVCVALTFTSDAEMINGSNRVVANRLLRAGVRVFINPRMTHVKALAVDGCWAYLGTGNFDPLSFRRNYEVGLALSACPLVRDLERRLFLPDFQPEWEMHEPVPTGAGDYLAELIAGLWL